MRRVLALMMILLLLPINSFADVLGSSSGYITPNSKSGVGGGISLTPSFRIGIIDEEWDDPLKATDPKETEQQIWDNYATHFPYLTKSIVFTPSEISDKGVGKLGWYDPGSSSIHYDTIEDASKKHRIVQPNISMMEPVPDDTGRVFMPELIAQTQDKSIKALEGKWEEIVESRDPNGSKSAGVISYAFADYNTPSEIDRRFRNIVMAASAQLSSDGWWSVYDNLRPEQKEPIIRNNELGYLELMMMLYAMQPDSQKPFYADKINEFIAKPDVFNNPPLISIDTVTRVSVVGDSGTVYFFIPSTNLYDHTTC